MHKFSALEIAVNHSVVAAGVAAAASDHWLRFYLRKPAYHAF